jgi:class 3 adenylate cyclase
MSNLRISPRFFRKCLYLSFTLADMERFARMAYPDYDIYKKSGFPYGMPIPPQDAANRIAEDMLQDGYYLDFVELLLRIDSEGYMGRHYKIVGLDDVVTGIIEAGFNFDKITGLFFENQQERITRNWGRLLEGEERKMAVLRMDIAGNSALVKENQKNLIEKAYNDLRKIVSQVVVSRLGRLWSWEGDGALAAFMLSDYSRMAIFAGIEILTEMFLYNKLDNPLKSEIKLRLSVNSGSISYSGNEIECLKADIVKKAITLESKAAVPNSIVISESLAVTQDQAMLDIFSNAKGVSTEKYRIYQLNQQNE